MFEVNIFDVSAVKDSLMTLRRHYESQEAKTMMGKDFCEWRAEHITQLYAKFSQLYRYTAVTGVPDPDAKTIAYIYEVEEHEKLIVGTKMKKPIQCICGTRFSTDLQRAECPDCKKSYELMENPRGI